MSHEDFIEALTGTIEVRRDSGTLIYRDRDGQIHRTGGPAVICADGSLMWYFRGQRHRTDGPAIEWRSGGEEWYQNGVRHRTDGPAIIFANGDVRWFINGVRATEGI